jgi:pimeloyl-ACP methyl ester carboxylesterase
MNLHGGALVRFAFSLLLAGSGTARAQEIVALPTRPGITQSFFIARMQARAPQAVAVLFVGGGGNIHLRTEAGGPKFGDHNFLPRARREFIRNGVLPVVMDAPTDQQPRMSDAYRSSEEQNADVRAVVKELRRRYPALPVFLVGTSRGTISVAYLARALGAQVDGAVLTSSLFGQRWRPVLTAFDWSRVKVPLLLVHHREDRCPATPYSEAQRLGATLPLVSVKGGRPPDSGPCEPFAAHGYYGREPETVDAICRWMLKQPFPREID